MIVKKVKLGSSLWVAAAIGKFPGTHAQVARRTNGFGEIAKTVSLALLIPALDLN
jgi:hypothetical protein